MKNLPEQLNVCKSFFGEFSRGSLALWNSFTTIQNLCQINVVNNFDLLEWCWKRRGLAQNSTIRTENTTKVFRWLMVNFQIDRNVSIQSIFLESKVSIKFLPLFFSWFCQNYWVIYHCMVLALSYSYSIISRD